MTKNAVDKGLIVSSLADLMEEGYGRYAKYIIQDRALPDVRDGLKPVQRRILFMMYRENTLVSKPPKKSAKTVGDVMGNLHPHGDSSIYEAMVNLSQDFKANAPLIEMHGNNGSIDGDRAAAMRYTESRLSAISEKLLSEIDMETVDFQNNYSDTLLEPLVLPAQFCHILVNGSVGIASGYATDIPTFNFNEVMEASIYRLLNPECQFEEIAEIIKGPDFPTGAIIEGMDDVRQVLLTGKGRFVVRAKVDKVEGKKVNQLVVTEIPYGIKKSDLVKRLSDVRVDKNLDDILDVRDESDRMGLRIVVDVKKEADLTTIVNVLYKESDLQTYYNANMIAIQDRRPKLMGVVEILDAFLSFRKEVVTKRTRFLLSKASKRLHILEGLMKAISYLDEVIALIRASKNKQESKEKLIDRFGFSDEQAEAIVTLQLYRLSNTDIGALKEEFAVLVNQIDRYQQILDQPKILNNELVQEFKQLLKDFNQSRRTVLKEDVKDVAIDHRQLIPNEMVYVTMSKSGYLKRVSLRSMSASDQAITSLRAQDQLIGQAQTSTLSHLLAISNKGQAFGVMAYDIPEAKWKDVGHHFSSFVSTSEDQEQLVAGFLVDHFDKPLVVTMVTRLGRVKSSLLSDFSPGRMKRAFRAMKLADGDEIVAVTVSAQYSQDRLVMVTKEGYLVSYLMEDISLMGLNAQGVKAMNLGSKDEIVAMTILSDQDDLVVMGHQGLAKRLKAEEIPLLKRSAKGILVAKRNKSNPVSILDMVSGPLDRVLTLGNDTTVQVKDIRLMGVNQTFSQAMDPDTYVIKGIENLDEIDLIQVKTTKKEPEQLSFDF